VALRTRRPVTEHVPIGAALLLFAALPPAFVVIPAPLARADTMGFDARPQPGSPKAELGFFKFDAAGGETVQRVLVLTNRSDTVNVITVAACDGLAAVFGGVACSDSDKKPKTVGSWIQLSSTSVHVPPGSTVEMPVDVKVPADVMSGDQVGGIALWEPAAATTSGTGGSGGDKASTKITIVTRLVLTVRMITLGPAVPELNGEGSGTRRVARRRERGCGTGPTDDPPGATARDPTRGGALPAAPYACCLAWPQKGRPGLAEVPGRPGHVRARAEAALVPLRRGRPRA
jgi:hypothetical protein